MSNHRRRRRRQAERAHKAAEKARALPFLVEPRAEPVCARMPANPRGSTPGPRPKRPGQGGGMRTGRIKMRMRIACSDGWAKAASFGYGIDVDPPIGDDDRRRVPNPIALIPMGKVAVRMGPVVRERDPVALPSSTPASGPVRNHKGSHAPEGTPIDRRDPIRWGIETLPEVVDITTPEPSKAHRVRIGTRTHPA